MLAEDTRHPERQPIVFKKEVGQNIKDKKIDKRVRDRDPSLERVVKEEKFPNTRKLSHWQVCGEFWNLRRQHNQEEKINKTHRLHA